VEGKTPISTQRDSIIKLPLLLNNLYWLLTVCQAWIQELNQHLFTHLVITRWAVYCHLAIFQARKTWVVSVTCSISTASKELHRPWPDSQDKSLHSLPFFLNHFTEEWLTYDRLHVFNIYISKCVRKYPWDHKQIFTTSQSFLQPLLLLSLIIIIIIIYWGVFVLFLIFWFLFVIRTFNLRPSPLSKF
jgi:hypothetical protein